MIKRQELTVTTDGSGAGTVTTARPVGGHIVEIRNDSAAWGGTADYTFTRASGEGGGTVASLTNLAGPFSVYPGGSVYGMTSAHACIPVEGYLTMVVAGAASTVAGTVHVYYSG